MLFRGGFGIAKSSSEILPFFAELDDDSPSRVIYAITGLNIAVVLVVCGL